MIITGAMITTALPFRGNHLRMDFPLIFEKKAQPWISNARRCLHHFNKNALDRRRRSILHASGSSSDALKVVRIVKADSVMLDLEDSVETTSEAKTAARALVLQELRQGGFGNREVTVRVNVFESPWGREDVAAVAPAGPDAIILPRVESASQIRALEDQMDVDGAPQHTVIGAMIETPLGVLNAKEIAASSRRLAFLVVGSVDLTNALRARHTKYREPLVTSLGITVLAARAYGLQAIDGITLDTGDEATYRMNCVQARDMGFDGKTLYKGGQGIDIVHEVFS